MRRHIPLILLIGLAWGQPNTVAVFDFENQVLTFKKDDKSVVIKPNQKLYINDSIMVYKGTDYKNKQIKLESLGELILSFDAINSFRYQIRFNISNSLDKAGDYTNVGGILGCLYGCYAMAEILNRPNDMFAFAKIFAPLAPVMFGGFGGLLGGLTGGLVGLISPSFSDVMIIGDGEWNILDKRDK